MTAAICALILAISGVGGERSDTLKLMFWNLENFFDWRNDSTSVSDAEFSSRGARHWTRKRFNAKANAIAKGILWTAGEKGAMPDVIGFAELENAFVLRRLLHGTALEKLDYGIVHFDSPDPRGIDVGLIYRKGTVEVLEARPVRLDTALVKTRDILFVRLRKGAGEELGLMITHFPSKYGGTAASEPKRRLAAARLASLADSLRAAGLSCIVAAGDFNDTPDNPLFEEMGLVSIGLPLWRRGTGSIKYEGTWELIDLAFASEACADTKMEVVRIPFLLTRDTAYGGDKPLRTYTGPRYQGGVSDHCPLWLEIPLSF